MYNSKELESKIINIWEENKNILLRNLNKKDNYSVILPPPNITGSLHIGHSFQQTIMDMLIRFNKMNGKNIYCQYGIDHAGIATQIIIEKEMNFYKNKFNINDKEYKNLLKKTWIWKKEVNEKIIYQMKKMGNFIDYSNTRFTLDKRFSFSVKTAFMRLYEDNFIYRDKRIVNWDTKINSVISDLEINYKEFKGNTWEIKFPILHENNRYEKNNFIIISTTRPETLLGDSAIAVNPKDKRYLNLIGKNVLVPIVNRIIPIISDQSVDMLKGSGCVKITPAHSFNDYNIGMKNNLPIINIFNKNGKITKYAEISYFNNLKVKYELLPYYTYDKDSIQTRNIIIEKLEDLNLINSINTSNILIPYSNKTNSIVENIVTNQWFIKTKDLSKEALYIIKKKKIKFLSNKYINIYIDWINNIQDWCISRQIWWGHRIPVWYDNNSNIYVGFNEKEVRYKYKLEKDNLLYKENDVLDTWFSSSLWTFASLGWPKNTKKLKYFHPANIVISGFDIIFFWIFRMIMITKYLINKKNNKFQIPFKYIYITGLIKDENNNKMSKSKGNIIDPIDIIDGISLEDLINKRIKNLIKEDDKNKIINFTKKKFPNGIESQGADALRFAFITLSHSNDKSINWNLDTIKGYKKFCNKLWNLSKFIFINISKKDFLKKIEFNYVKIDINKWILIKLNDIIKDIYINIKNHRLDLYANLIYDFVWNEFCSWYLEFSKYYLNNGDNIIKNEVKNILIHLLSNILKILHPIIPFITEEIWQKLKLLDNNINYYYNDFIILNKFPKVNKLIKYDNSVYIVNFIKNIIINIRILKNKLLINSNKLYLVINLISLEKIKIIESSKNIILKMTNFKYLILNKNIKSNEYILKKDINDDIKLFVLNII